MYNTYRPRRTKGSQRAEFVRENNAQSYVVGVEWLVKKKEVPEAEYYVNLIRSVIRNESIYGKDIISGLCGQCCQIIENILTNNDKFDTSIKHVLQNFRYLLDNKIFTELDQLKHISTYHHKAYVLESDKFGQIRKGDVFIHTQHGTSLTVLTVADIRHGKLRLKSFAKPLTKFITLKEFESREIMKLWR